LRTLIIHILLTSILIISSIAYAAPLKALPVDEVYEVMDQMAEQLVKKQEQDGRFEAPFEADPGFELLSLVLINRHEKRDREMEKKFIAKALKWRSTSGFGSYPKGPYNHDVTGLVLLSLEKLGYKLENYKLQDLKAHFEHMGGIKNLNLGTKMLLAPLGMSDAGSLEKILKPALLKLPSIFPISNKEIGIFRSLLIPLVSWNYFRKLNHVSEARSQTAKDSIQWILDHQMPNGTWYTLFHAIVNLSALTEAQRIGYGSYNSEIKKAIKAIKSWRTLNYEGDITQQLTLTTGWDTPQSLIALSELPAEIQNKHRDAINNAIAFLDHNQINVPGDWSINSPNLTPGGWSFIVENTDYPDTDVVAAILEGKRSFSDDPADEKFIKGMNWVLGLQNKDGGYPAWERGVSKAGDKIIKTVFSEIPDYSDLSQSDVTSRITRLVYKIKDSTDFSTKERQALNNAYIKGCRFIHRASENGVYWKGRWLVAYLYGTSEALDTLASTNCIPLARLNKTVQWLVGKQNKDGGFGEDHTSFIQNLYVNRSSTVMQTSYVVHGLIAYEERHQKEFGKFSPYKKHLDRAIRYLMDKAIEGNGHIVERSFTGVIGAKLWYSDYSLSPQFMTLRALGRYHRLSN
jgi:squalene cyclase